MKTWEESVVKPTIEAYEKAYRKANGHPSNLCYRRGWYYLGISAFRRNEILTMTENLRNRPPHVTVRHDA